MGVLLDMGEKLCALCECYVVPLHVFAEGLRFLQAGSLSMAGMWKKDRDQPTRDIDIEGPPPKAVLQ